MFDEANIWDYMYGRNSFEIPDIVAPIDVVRVLPFQGVADDRDGSSPQSHDFQQT